MEMGEGMNPSMVESFVMKILRSSIHIQVLSFDLLLLSSALSLDS